MHLNSHVSYQATNKSEIMSFESTDKNIKAIKMMGESFILTMVTFVFGKDRDRDGRTASRKMEDRLIWSCAETEQDGKQ